MGLISLSLFRILLGTCTCRLLLTVLNLFNVFFLKIQFSRNKVYSV